MAETDAPLARIRAVATRRRKLDEDLFAAITLALAANYSWTKIGEAMGISRQAARRWYSRRTP